jgi:ATP-dependent RNA helicase DDX1
MAVPGRVRFFVLDEADRLLDTGNQETILKLHQRCAQGVAKPANLGAARLQTLLFSATLHDPVVRALSAKIQHHPAWLDLKGQEAVPETVHHVLLRVNPDPAAEPALAERWRKRDTRLRTDGVHDGDFNPQQPQREETRSEALKRLKPQLLVELIEKFEMAQAFIFVRTQLDADNLEAFLLAVGGGRAFGGKAESGKENPFSCTVLHGGRPHRERQANLAAFKEGDVRLLICTDVAARGLDIVGMPFCINMTLPDKAEDYIHRVGRVGRADSMGLAISLVAAEGCREKVWFYDKRKWAKKKLSTALATVGPHGNPTGGGCCIWYDEPQLLAEVHRRLKVKQPGGISTITWPKLTLPSHMLAAEAYGGDRPGLGGDPNSGSGHAELLAEPVARLRELEKQAMKSYYSLQRTFGVQHTQ